MIDAHQHFWSIATPGHEWPTPTKAAIHRDFGPEHFQAAAGQLPVHATIVVQSQPTDIDTDWLLSLAGRTSFVAGVVGWVDLQSPVAPARIAALAQHPKLRGLRPMLQSIPETDWLLRDDVAPAIDAMIAQGLRFDALVKPRHLSMLTKFTARWPNLPIVIDHAAKPFVSAGIFDPWRKDIAALAERGVWCKLSGLRTEQDQGQPAVALQPYVDHLLRCFGERLMWGSDWPVLSLSGDTYQQWAETAEALAGVEGAERDRLFSSAAAEFYGLDLAMTVDALSQ